MRIRTVKPEFFTDSKVRSLPYEARLLFIGLFCFADDEGRFENDPDLIKALIFPTDDVNVVENLRLLARKELIKLYKVYRKRFYLIPGWHRHQKINRPSAPRTPPPVRRVPHKKKPKTCTHGVLTQNAAGKGREGKGKEESFARSRNSCTQEVTCLSEAFKPPDGKKERANERALLSSLEKLLTPATLRRLMHDYPLERLHWALDIFKAAKSVRKIDRPGSYFMRIARDDDQYERYMCDQLALGHEKARKRQEALARKCSARCEEAKKRKLREEDAAFRQYLDTVPVGVAQKLTEYSLNRWAAESGVDLEKLRRKGHLLQRSVDALYETHVRTAWLEHDRPEEYKSEHLEPPDISDNASRGIHSAGNSTTENTEATEKRGTTGEHR